MKALIVAPSWIGDAVMAQPLFVRLHERFPGIELHAFAPRWVAPVLHRMPEISNVIDNPFGHGELSLKARWRLARELKGIDFTHAYVLPNSLKSALIPFMAGIPKRVGFTGESRMGLINRRHTLDEKALPQMAERFAQLAEDVGTPLPRPISLPKLTSSLKQQMASFTLLGLNRPNKLVIFCPGAEYGPAKRWPARHFATLATELSARGYAVWSLGSATDAPIGDEIASLAAAQPSATKVHNLCGKTSLDQAIDLIAAANFVVCNDSGLMHVAAAVGRPLTALYGSSSPDFTPPLSPRAKVISLKLECSPCFKRECPLGHLNCLQKLDPEQVLKECLP